MESELWAKLLVAAVALPISMLTAYAFAEAPSDGLAPPESFSAIQRLGLPHYSPSSVKC